MTQEEQVATFAGGCFWCMVEPFDERPGIIEVISGYTGGTTKNPTYAEVTTNTTGHVEAVQITYNPTMMSYQNLIDTFWQQIDPTDAGGQFNDRGEAYKTAIFYHNEEQKEIALLSKQKLSDSGKFSKPIVTNILPAQPFYNAENAHQHYYQKQPFHYQLYKKGSGREAFLKKNQQQNYDKKALQNKLTPMQYHVTQENGTEPPYQNEYWDNNEEGIYVDIISKEVLFSSRDQFDAQCGWPSFTKPVDPYHVEEEQDTTHGMIRTEVRSKDSDSHLGHVFEDGPKEHGGLRYCMNSASLEFIPRDEMAEKGYEKFLHLLKKS